MNECPKCGQAGMREVTHACMTAGRIEYPPIPAPQPWIRVEDARRIWNVARVAEARALLSPVADEGEGGDELRHALAKLEEQA